ncbi:MAG: ZIP family metal transporter [Candidatus Bathyarchaeia archaeon]
MTEILQPFLLSLIAGSATGIGGLVVLVFGRVSDRIMGFLIGFAGGVMLIVSFLDLFIEALAILSYLEVTLAFAVGALFMMAIDLALPHMELGRWERGVVDSRLFKTGLVIAIGITLHNLPEGLVVSAGYAHIPKLGLLIAITICLHNIPEGIATATPLTLAGVGKLRASALAFLSGLTEPIGALIGATVLSTLGGRELGACPRRWCYDLHHG